MKPPINLVGGAFFSVIVSVVGLAEPLNNGINFEEIEPGLGFGTPCAQAQAHLTHIGVSYKQMSEHQWILITRGQIIGHALYRTNEFKNFMLSRCRDLPSSAYLVGQRERVCVQHNAQDTHHSP